MPLIVDRTEVRKLLKEGAHLIDVLPEASFSEAHLPGAVSLPLKQLTRERVAALDSSEPVIVYCHDYL